MQGWPAARCSAYKASHHCKQAAPGRKLQESALASRQEQVVSPKEVFRSLAALLGRSAA